MAHKRIPLALTLVLATAAALIIADTASASPARFRYGLNRLVPSAVSPGYAVYTGLDGVIYAIDVEGHPVLELAAPNGFTYSYARPLDNGNLLVRVEEDATNVRSIVEINQSGVEVWSFEQPNGYTFHHDHSRLPNGNTLIMCAQVLLRPHISPEDIVDDCLLEVTPAGDIVWEWQAADHYDDFAFDEDWLQAIADHSGDWAHGNAASAIPINTSHADPRFRPGNIIISFRHLNSIVIVDRDTGDIVWRTDGLTIGQHDPEMLPDDLPGGGRILAFDNGLGGHYNFGGTEVWSESSRIVEIDPNTTTVAWEYDANDSGLPRFFFSSYFISSAQRLPNGNTFIDEGAYGRFFEVTPSGRMVWEFISPALGTFQGVVSNRVYRAEKVPLDWLAN